MVLRCHASWALKTCLQELEGLSRLQKTSSAVYFGFRRFLTISLGSERYIKTLKGFYRLIRSSEYSRRLLKAHKRLINFLIPLKEFKDSEKFLKALKGLTRLSNASRG